MKRYSLFTLFLLFVSLLPYTLYGEGHQDHGALPGNEALAASGAEQAPSFPPLPAPGKEVPIDNGHYFTYGFDKNPKLGTMIMKVQIFSRDGSKDTSFTVHADAGMPSMKGAHETGEQPFQLSKKGAYLLPINIVMPGEWEVRFTLLKDGKPVCRGSYRFDV